MAKTRVLIVEDEFIIAEAIRDSLESMGYLVTSVVNSGEKAVFRASEDKPDIIIMDITLKGETDGIDAAQQIKTNHDIPVVFLTAHADEHFLERAKVTEPFGYLLKPFKPRELKATIEMSIYKKKMDDALRELNKGLEDKVRNEVEKNQQQEQLLIQQSKLASMGEMISAIAHQWKQPLNALGLIIQDIRETYDDEEMNDDFIDETIENSMSQINFMSDTIDGFRNFFKVSKRKVVFSLNDAINDIVKLLAPQFKSNAIIINYYCCIPGEKEEKSLGDIEKNISNDSVFVHGYPNEFKQVVLNIIANAKDAITEKMEEGNCNDKINEIDMDISEKGESILVEIKDSAGGIPELIIERIFESHFTTKEDGTGIGLYIAKTIIEKNMEGKLTVANEGNGAKFLIELKRVI